MILAPFPKYAFLDNNGRPLIGGQLFTYIAGTTTKIATYTDSTGGVSNTNPIVLDYRGEANVWLDPTLTYKFTLAPPGDTDPPTRPIWTVDQVSGLGGLTQQIIGQLLWPRTAAEIAVNVTPVNYAYPPYVRGRYASFADWKSACDQAGAQGLLEANYAIASNTPLPNKFDFEGFALTGAFYSTIAPASLGAQGGYALNWTAKQPRIQGAFFNDFVGINTGLDDTGSVLMDGTSGGSSWSKIGVKYATTFVLDATSSYITQNLITGGILRFIPMVGAGNEINANVFDNVDVSAPTAANLASGTVTISNGSPAVVTWNTHGKNAGNAVVFTTTGALPTGLNTNTVYYVIAAGLATNTFQVSLTPGGAAVNTSSAGSGVHTATSFGVLQTDTLREPNTFRNVYWENGSNIRANAHLNGWHADGLGNPALDRYCHALFNTNVNQKLRTDFLSLSISNLVTGGDWSILDAAGKPPDLAQSLGAGVAVVADNTDPSGIGKRYEATFSAAFTNFSITMQPSGSDRFSLVLYYKSTADFFAIESNDGGGAISQSETLSLVSQGYGNNWKRLWISGPASKTSTTTVTLFAYGAVGGAAKTMSISGMFAGSEGCVIPPQKNNSILNSTFTGTLNGVTALVQGTVKVQRVGNCVTMHIPSLTGTSNSTSCSISGLPAALIPAAASSMEPCIIDDNSVTALGRMEVTAAGAITVYPSLTAAATGWTAAGTKTVTRKSITYFISP